MKYILPILLSLALSLTLTACTTAEETKSDTSSNLTVENENIIEGKVTRVDGNQIQIDVGTIKTSQRQGTGENAEPPSDNSTGGTDSRKSGERASGTGSASRPNGADETSGMPSFATTTIELTGESKTLEIPVGTPVYMTVRGESSKVDFTRLSEDNLIKISMNDEDKVLSITVVS